VLSIHSFTPRLNRQFRPWHVGVSARKRIRFARSMADELEQCEEICVGWNQPYEIEDAFDHTIPTHAERRGLAGALVELRQDMLRTTADIDAWAFRLGAVVAGIVSGAGSSNFAGSR